MYFYNQLGSLQYSEAKAVLIVVLRIGDALIKAEREEVYILQIPRSTPAFQGG